MSEDEKTKPKPRPRSGTSRQRRESRLPPLARVMVDPLKQYEIIPNGNPRFLTKASQKKILEVREGESVCFVCLLIFHPN